MRSLSCLSLLLVSLLGSSLFLDTQASSGHGNIRRNHRNSLAVARDVNPNSSASQLQPRDSGSFTWFDTGLGACGGTNSANDFIVAINIPQYADGSACYKTITLTYQGKSAQAQIVDRCEHCSSGDLDLSKGLFQYLIGDPVQIGMVNGQWSFGAAESTTTTSSTPSPTPTSTTTSTPPLSSTWTPTSTSQSTSLAPSSSSSIPTSSSASTSSTATSSSASATASSGLQVLGQVQIAFIQLAEVAAGAYKTD